MLMLMTMPVSFVHMLGSCKCAHSKHYMLCLLIALYFLCYFASVIEVQIDTEHAGVLRHLALYPYFQMHLWRLNSLLLFVKICSGGNGVLHVDGTKNLLRYPGMHRGSQLLHTKIAVSTKVAALPADQSSQDKSSNLVSPTQIGEIVGSRYRTIDLAEGLLDFDGFVRDVAADFNIPYRPPRIILVDCDTAQLQALIATYSCHSKTLSWHEFHNISLRIQLNFDDLEVRRFAREISSQDYKNELALVDAQITLKLSVIIVLCRAHVVRAAEKKAKQIDNAGPVMNVIIEALQKITYIPHLSMAIANLSVLIALLETEEVLLDVNDESKKGKPKKEGANGERAIRKNIGIKLKQFIQKKAMELTTPVSEATAYDEAQDNRKFTQIHEDVVKAAKNSLVANLFVAWRDLDRSESKSNSKSKPKSKPKSKSTSKSKSKSSNEGVAGDECEDDDDDVADADADGSPHFISCYCVIGYQDRADGSGDIDDKGKMYSYSHKQEKTASIPCKLSGEKGGKTLVKNPVFNKKAAEYLRWWMMRIAYVCPGLLAIHKRLTNTTVKGNNQLSESIMKAIKIESNVRLHSSGIGEYILYANREMDADVIKAVQQISQLPSRTRKRNQLRASRSSKLAAVIEEIDEEEESKWNRTPGQEFESNKLRQELKSLEEKEGRVQGSEIYESISDWISKEKGLVRHELTSRGELMSISTFLKWYLREGMLGKKKKWKENLEGYIDKGPTEPMTKKAKKSPVKAGGR